jgi:hypothetical protein
MNKFKCSSCRFYDGVKDAHEFGKCHVNPPVTGQGFPNVAPTDFCGRWEVDMEKVGIGAEQIAKVRGVTDCMLSEAKDALIDTLGDVDAAINMLRRR